MTIQKSNGGPSSYYDVFQQGEMKTANDVIETMAKTRWFEHSCHMKDIFKACIRWGAKSGTDKGYDARKIAYSGIRLIVMLEGKENAKKFIQELDNDDQFS